MPCSDVSTGWSCPKLRILRLPHMHAGGFWFLSVARCTEVKGRGAGHFGDLCLSQMQMKQDNSANANGCKWWIQKPTIASWEAQDILSTSTLRVLFILIHFDSHLSCRQSHQIGISTSFLLVVTALSAPSPASSGHVPRHHRLQKLGCFLEVARIAVSTTHTCPLMNSW